MKAQPAQPDGRIHKFELGSFTCGGRRFVVNLRRGVPRNACVEQFRGKLRCWASRTWLDDHAARYVRANSTTTDNNAFVWNEGVEVKETWKG